MFAVRTSDNVIIKVERITYPSQNRNQPLAVCLVVVMEVDQSAASRPYMVAFSNAKPGMVLKVPAAALMRC